MNKERTTTVHRECRCVRYTAEQLMRVTQRQQQPDVWIERERKYASLAQTDSLVSFSFHHHHHHHHHLLLPIAIGDEIRRFEKDEFKNIFADR